MKLALFAAFSLIQLLCINAQWGPFLEPCRTNDYPPPSNIAPELPWFVVDLDQPAELRWTEIATQFTKEIQAFFTFLEALVPTDHLRTMAEQFVDEYFELILNRVAPGDLAAEIVSIAQATNLTVGEVVLAQLGYDFTAACTSIVATAPNASVTHARNLDFGKFLGWNVHDHTFEITKLLRAMAINVDFRRQNKTLFQTVQFAGQVGVLTGVRPGVVSISVNTRHVTDWRQSGLAGIIQWVIMQNDSSQFVSLLVRQVLEQATTFQEAEQMLAQTPLVAPVYFTIASGDSANKTGCVLTRSHSGLDEERCLSASAANNSWFVLQTNYDWWTDPPTYDNRRAPAMKCMEQLGGLNQQLNGAGLFNVLSTKPVRNLGTVFTSIMRPMLSSSAESDAALLESYQRECLDWDCWPF